VFYVYLLASRRHGTLYLGVTNDLVRRVYEHKAKVVPGFTAEYGVDRLVWFEAFEDPSAAIKREKAIKKWRRDWKIRLIEEQNPYWQDLFPEIAGVDGHSGAQAEPARPEPVNADRNGRA
jgi:putative endonuclease